MLFSVRLVAVSYDTEFNVSGSEWLFCVRRPFNTESN